MIKKVKKNKNELIKYKNLENKASIFNIITQDTFLHIVAIIFIGVLLSIHLKNVQIVATHDGGLHMKRIYYTIYSLSQGYFPPLISPLLCNNFGYSMNIFYQPIVTYIPMIFSSITGSISVGLKYYACFTIIASGITMYVLGRKITKSNGAAFIMAFFYMIAPYKLLDVYVRFAIGEFTALVFVPLVFYGLYDLINDNGKKHYFIAIGAICIVLSHTLTSLYLAIFCLIYILINVKKLNMEKIKKIVINLIFIILISLFFIGPLIEANSLSEYTIFSDKWMKTDAEYMMDHGIEFSELFSIKENDTHLVFLMGISTFVFLMSTFYACFKVRKEHRKFYWYCFILGILCVIGSLKVFPWNIMPSILCKLQYPWRLLGFSNFFFAFVCGLNLVILIDLIKDNKRNLKLFLICAFIIIALIETIAIEHQFKYLNDDKNDVKTEESLEKNEKTSHWAINRDYLPIRAIELQNTYLTTRQDSTYVLEGNVSIDYEKKDELYDKVMISNGRKGSILEFPYYFYPDYEIKVTENGNSRIVNIQESKNGFLQYELENDVSEAVVEVYYRPTTITKICYIISGISFIAFVVYIIFENKNSKKNRNNKNNKESENGIENNKDIKNEIKNENEKEIEKEKEKVKVEVEDKDKNNININITKE